MELVFHQTELRTNFLIDLESNYLLQKLQVLYPNEKIALIKYSKVGSSIDSLAAGRFGSWESDYNGTNGINQYDNFLATIKEALQTNDIDGDGKEDL